MRTLGTVSRKALLSLAVVGSVSTALAADPPIPFRPDEAVLACSARSVFAIEAETGQIAKPAERFRTERRDAHMWHVEGAFTATLEGEERRIDVACDVSSEGVEVFTMAVERG